MSKYISQHLNLLIILPLTTGLWLGYLLVLTTYDDDAWVFDAIRAGVADYLLKDTPREDFIKAVRGTVEEKSFGRTQAAIIASRPRTFFSLSRGITRKDDGINPIVFSDSMPAVWTRLPGVFQVAACCIQTWEQEVRSRN